jgi:glycosyltransferase involved in cell wall biosynthesis
MTHDPTSADEAQLTAPDDALTNEEQRSEARIEQPTNRAGDFEHLRNAHGERVRELEADRWRLNERIEALEAQNSELQASFIEQTRGLERELLAAKAAEREEQQRRLADVLEARRNEAEHIDRMRSEMAAELQRQEQRLDRMLTELLKTKDALVSLASEHRDASARQQAEAAAQLTSLRRELALEVVEERKRSDASQAALLQAKGELVELHHSHSAELRSHEAAIAELKKLHEAELSAREERASARYELLLATSSDEARSLRERIERLVEAERERTEQAAERTSAAADESRQAAALALDLQRALDARAVAEAQLEQLRAAVTRQQEQASAEDEHAAQELERLREELATERARYVPVATHVQAAAGSSAEQRERTATSVPDGTPLHVQLQKQEAEANRLRQTIATLEREAARYRTSAANLQSRLDKTRDTLSFRLGYALIHAPKSWQAMRSLPGDLLALQAEARRRREAKRQGHREAATPTSATQTPVSSLKFADEVVQLFGAEGAAAAARFADFAAPNDQARSAAFTQLAKAVKTSDLAAAKRFAERAYDLEPLPFRAKWLAFVKYEAGEIRAPAALLDSLPTEFVLKPSEKARIAEVCGLARLQLALPSIPPASVKFRDGVADTVMYVAASALPFHVSGYTVRTQALLRAIEAAGFRVTATLRPGYPADRGVDVPAGAVHAVDGVSYRVSSGAAQPRRGLDEYMEMAAAALSMVAHVERPALVHAASNHVNALPALLTARRLGVPFVYEVRGLWELTAATRNLDWEQTERFALERDLETLVATNADHVLTLTNGLADELAARGVAREKISIVHNSVDEQRFTPRRKDAELMLRFGLNSTSFTVVYAGSLLYYEGVDDLVRALDILLAKGLDATLVIAGDGEAMVSLQELVAELRLERRVKLVGKLSPEDIPGLWSLADAAAFPRKPFKVCQLVSPLKPLEPMAMGVPVVVSDVAALREMVREGELGLIHRAGDFEALAARLSELAADAANRQRLGKAARAAVLEERLWSVAGQKVVEIYRRLLRPGLPLPHPVAQARVEIVPLTPGRSAMSAEEKALFEERLEQAFATGGAAEARDLANRQAAGRSDRLLAFCLLKAASLCQRQGDAAALELVRSALERDRSSGSLRSAARTAYAAGDITEAVQIVDRLERALGALTGKDKELANEIRSRSALLRALDEPRRHPSVPAIPDKSVYFLHFSLPYTSVGYATRSHGLLAGIRHAGFDVKAYTRCGFPLDFKPELEGRAISDVDVIDGIEYHRLLDGGRRASTESEYLLNSADAYERVLRVERPQVVHAASNYVTALPALIAARRLGLPFIYEVRGFWEITRSSRDNEFESSARFASMRHFEGVVARAADHVFTLTSAMKDELIRRGVAAAKISLVHNGVDPERFVPVAPKLDLAARLGLPPGVPVIGYVGSFVDYEGLDDLISACGLLARRGLDFRLLLVGDGGIIDELRRLVATERLDDRVLLPGRIPHDEVESYYSLLDVCPFPRKPWEVCEMVSPLKPFEAMAMAKAVVVSSTHALSEIVTDGVNGLVFEKGNKESLANVLQRLLEDHQLRGRLEQAGRAWAISERTWRKGGHVVVDGYRSVLAAPVDVGEARVTA